MRPDDTAPDGAVLIPLRARDGSIRAYAIVDATDAGILSRWRWRLDRYGYARRNSRKVNGRQQTIMMHRDVLGLKPGDGFEVDHIDRDRLNNRRINLRVVARNAQMQNQSPHTGGSSRHRGVYWNAKERRWRAGARVNGKQYHFGSFVNEDDAAEAARAGRLRLMPFSHD